MNINHKSAEIRKIFFSLFSTICVLIILVQVLINLEKQFNVPKDIAISVIVILALCLGTTILLEFKFAVLKWLLWKKSSFRKIVFWGFLGGALIVGIIILPYPERYANLCKINQLQEKEAGQILIDVLLIGIVLPLIEELYFRGCLYRIITDNFHVLWGVTVSTALFVVGHGFWNPAQAVSVSIASLLLTLTFARANSVLASALAHSIYNIVYILTRL